MIDYKELNKKAEKFWGELTQEQFDKMWFDNEYDKWYAMIKSVRAGVMAVPKKNMVRL